MATEECDITLHLVLCSRTVLGLHWNRLLLFLDGPRLHFFIFFRDKANKKLPYMTLWCAALKLPRVTRDNRKVFSANKNVNKYVGRR